MESECDGRIHPPKDSVKCERNSCEQEQCEQGQCKQDLKCEAGKKKERAASDARHALYNITLMRALFSALLDFLFSPLLRVFGFTRTQPQTLQSLPDALAIC